MDNKTKILIICILITLYFLFNINNTDENFSMIFNGIKDIKLLKSNNDIDNSNIYPISSYIEYDEKIKNEKFNKIENIINKVKILFNEKKNKILFNEANRPMTTEKKTYDEIKSLIITIYSYIKMVTDNLKIIRVENIIEYKTENQVKIDIRLILETDEISNIATEIEIIYEKIYSDEDLFYNMNKPEIKLYLFRFDINRNYNLNYLFR